MMSRQFSAMLLSFTVLVAGSLPACSTETLENDHIFASLRSGEDVSKWGWIMVTSFLPMDEGQALRLRLNGRDLVWGPEDPSYVEILERGGSMGALVPAGDYTVELFDRSGRTWTTAGPIKVLPPNPEFSFPERESIAYFYGDAQAPSAFVTEPLAHDDDPETAELTVRNGRAAEAVVLERCVASGSPESDVCEVLTTLPAGDTWTGVLAQTHEVPPYLGEAYVRSRPAESAGYSSLGHIMSLNDHPEDYANGCQVSGAIITDYVGDASFEVLQASWSCGSL